MCHTVIAPAQVSADTARRAVEVARAAVGSLQGRGIFGVELFELRRGHVQRIGVIVMLGLRKWQI